MICFGVILPISFVAGDDLPSLAHSLLSGINVEYTGSEVVDVRAAEGRNVSHERVGSVHALVDITRHEGCVVPPESLESRFDEFIRVRLV